MSPLSRLVIVVALLAVVFVIASRGQHPPSDAIAFAENRTRCLAHCLTYKSPNPLSAERTCFTICYEREENGNIFRNRTHCRATCEEEAKANASVDACGAFCQFLTNTSLQVNETNGHLEAKDLKVKGSDLEWSEHDGTRDDDHIVYLPRFSIANQSNWQPLFPLKGTKVKLDPLLEKKTLNCDVAYQFQVAVFHELGMRGAYRNASGEYRKDCPKTQKCENKDKCLIGACTNFTKSVQIQLDHGNDSFFEWNDVNCADIAVKRRITWTSPTIKEGVDFCYVLQVKAEANCQKHFEKRWFFVPTDLNEVLVDQLPLDCSFTAKMHVHVEKKEFVHNRPKEGEKRDLTFRVLPLSPSCRKISYIPKFLEQVRNNVILQLSINIRSKMWLIIKGENRKLTRELFPNKRVILDRSLQELCYPVNVTFYVTDRQGMQYTLKNEILNSPCPTTAEKPTLSVNTMTSSPPTLNSTNTTDTTVTIVTPSRNPTTPSSGLTPSHSLTTTPSLTPSPSFSPSSSSSPSFSSSPGFSSTPSPSLTPTPTLTSTPFVTDAPKDPSPSSQLHIIISVIGGSLLFVLLIVIVSAAYVHREKRRYTQRSRVFELSKYKPPVLTPPVFNPVNPPDEWELDPDDVTLLEVIGEGFFGVVLKAQVFHKPSPRWMVRSRMNSSVRSNSSRRRSSRSSSVDGKQTIKSVVACKMLKETGTVEHQADLMEEIKLMKKIGQHQHIVSMLACITRNHPVCLIVEFCPHGDLLNYLKKGRPGWCSDSRRQSGVSRLKPNVVDEGYVPMRRREPSHHYINVSDEGKEDKSKDKDKDKDDELVEFTASDLLSFAWQIASGMEYLAANGLVHRDLACRNVLVLENKLLKVSDFGLTRAVHQDGIYPQKTTRRLPFRWMSVEAITDRVFTEQSDVWSFGVVMWEICTLGSFPYPSVSSRDLLSHVRKGNRLDCPENCSEELYRMMSQCWHTDPGKRPAFSLLSLQLGSMLEAERPTKYLNLDFSYSYPFWDLESMGETGSGSVESAGKNAPEVNSPVKVTLGEMPDVNSSSSEKNDTFSSPV